MTADFAKFCENIKTELWQELRGFRCAFEREMRKELGVIKVSLESFNQVFFQKIRVEKKKEKKNMIVWEPKTLIFAKNVQP